MLIRVQRKRQTSDGVFGVLSIDNNPFTAFTVENLEHIIPAGSYPIEFTYSPKFNKTLPLIDVPNRSGIRIHPANQPVQLDGCIAVGDKEEPDSVDNSRNTFNSLENIIADRPDLHIQITDIPKETPHETQST